MVRPTLLPLLALCACIGSQSPDRSPTGPSGPDHGSPPPVTPPPSAPAPSASQVATLTINAPSSITVGAQTQLSVVARDSLGRVVRGYLGHYYVSDSPTVASVTTDGLLVGLKPGPANVRALLPTIGANTTVVVTN